MGLWERLGQVGLVVLALLSLAGTMLTIVGFFSLIHHAFDFQLAPYTQFMLAAYEEQLAKFADRFEPAIEAFVRFLGGLIGTDLRLYSDWRYVWVPMVLFFNNDIIKNFKDRRWASLASGIVVGWPLAVVCCIYPASDSEPAGLNRTSFAVAMAAFAFWGLVQTFVTPFFHPYRYERNGIVVETPFLDGLKHYLRNTFLPMTLMALLAFAFGWLSFWLKATSTVIEIIAVSLPAFLFGISLWWIQQSRQNQARDKERGQCRRLGEYGAFRWAMRMLGRLAGVVVVLVANAAAIALTAGRAI